MRTIISTIVFPDKTLATRTKAIPFRKKIEEFLPDAEKKDAIICLDFSKVDFISTSFADECLGVLVSHYGFNTVVRHVRIKCPHVEIVNNIAEILKYRRDQLLQETDDFHTVNSQMSLA